MQGEVFWPETCSICGELDCKNKHNCDNEKEEDNANTSRN